MSATARLRHALRPRTRLRELRDRRAYLRLASARILRAFANAYPDAFFVELGANDGKQHDPLRELILRHGWRGIMVEPVPFVFERLQQNYRDVGGVALENLAIADRSGELPFFHLAEASETERATLPGWYDGIGSFDRDAVIAHGSAIPGITDRLVESRVSCVTYEGLLERHGSPRVDLLLVDTEGYDWEILRRLDLEASRPRLLVYEHYHLDPADRREALAMLDANGYETKEEGFDTFALDVSDEDTLTREFRRIEVAAPAVSSVDEIPGGAELSEEDRRYLTTLYDDSVPLPPGAEEELRDDNPALAELRAAYAALDSPALEDSHWHRDAIESFLDLRWFRGETLFTWHYREPKRVTELKYFAYLRYVADRDGLGLLNRVEEDGAFGCWTFDFEDHGRVSRDLLDSVNEINYLERHLDLGSATGLRVLDIGAGYGRLAHRMSEALPNLADYCCVDAIPEATFLSEYYLRHRGAIPPARVVRLDRFEAEVEPAGFDLAVNVHSFSECTHSAVAWWAEQLARLEVPRLLVIPNDGEDLLTTEPDASRRDFAPLLADAGYRRIDMTPVIEDPAAREQLRIEDRFHLFERG